jgi:hypothetical protein
VFFDLIDDIHFKSTFSSNLPAETQPIKYDRVSQEQIYKMIETLLPKACYLPSKTGITGNPTSFHMLELYAHLC